MAAQSLGGTGRAPDSPRPRLLLRTLLALAAALSSLVLIKLGLFAAVGTFIAWASLPKARAGTLSREHRLLALAALASAIGLFRFLKEEAMSGIVAGGNRATEQRVVSRLREVLFAEDNARRLASHDPDRDGIGSAALLGELTGELGLRGGVRLPAPLLESFPKLVQTPLGPASEVGGYFLLVCLPRAGGGFSAQPADAFDEELAERRFIAYAWPSGVGPGLDSAFALDEHERILVAPSVACQKRSRLDAPPRCDDAVAADTRAEWRPWRGKQPRQSLPGDR